MEIDEGFEAFRAGYPSAREAVAACENPIWLARIAFEAVKDKKSIVRAAKSATGLPAGEDEPGGWRFMLLPVLEPFEVIERWSGQTTEEDEGADGRMLENLRAAMLPFAACLFLMGFIAEGEIWTSLHSYRRLTAVGVGLGVLVIGWWLMKRWYRWLLRYQLARLDADTAFATVLKRLAKVRAKYPDHVAREVWFLRTRCLEVIDREAAFL